MPPFEIQLLRPVEDVAVAVLARGRRERRDVAPRLGLREREGGDRLARDDARDQRFALRLGSEERHGGRAKPLHREREVREAALVGERLAREAERAHVQLGAQAKEPGVGEPADERAAGRVGSLSSWASSPSPAANSSSSSLRARWRSSKNGQVEEAAVGHVSRPRRPGSHAPRTRGRRARSPRSACRSPGPAPRPSIASSRPIAHSSPSMRFVIACAKVGPWARSRGDRVRLALQLLGAARAGCRTPSARLVGAHRAPGQEQLGGAALADDSRQDRAGAHVAAGQADAREEECSACLGRREPDVGRHREDRAGACADPVDRGDDRLRGS